MCSSLCNISPTITLVVETRQPRVKVGTCQVYTIYYQADLKAILQVSRVLYTAAEAALTDVLYKCPFVSKHGP